ncbi:SDR family NAD(P)-dependent oxidoreductase [Pseudomonas sp. KNUC1026]|uniref:SDR family NAD(P)-dependent oxidoreductase n=1 Tax=Pseudomonas sp. KNUC1026 TaxID=2893890 RepID=UPI001F254DAD|nr:SDR family NAD(P)-dependent oxidoreductase [Pseudomonas sp. KNUC1026]UFH48641.1 SDR family oxidoreductase [Pseudomonas sp. KNUC1026]
MTEQPRTALVTGASSGIGLAIVERLLADGWAVMGLSRQRPALEHPSFSWRAVDLSDREATEAALGEIGPLHAVVHAAGVMRTAPLGELDLDAGAAMWRLHVEAATQLVDRLSGRLAESGRVILIGSRTWQGAAGRSQYAATKAALVGLVRSWAMELAPRGIAAERYRPGATDTPMLRDPGRQGTPPRVPPLGRFVSPEEVAAYTAFIAGPLAGAIAGRTLVMCGGASL